MPFPTHSSKPCSFSLDGEQYTVSMMGSTALCHGAATPMTLSKPSTDDAARTRDPQRVVLVGGGHAHVQILDSWAANPPRGAQLTLVVDDENSVYSGMVPGLLAGDYDLAQATISLGSLARRCGASLVLGRVQRVNGARKRVELESGDSVPYDLASLNIGSTVRGEDLPGVAAHALPTRPIGEFARRSSERLHAIVRDRAANSVAKPLRVVIVGAGAAGVELAFTVHHRLTREGGAAQVVVACGPAGVLPGYGRHVRHLIEREAARREIVFAATTQVTEVSENAVVFSNGTLRADLVLWATGAAPPSLLAASALPRGRQGFLRVASTLAVPGHAGLFAVGDCASVAGVDGAQDVAKAGVHAVRAGPVLDANLRASLCGAPLTEFRPQRHFLSLLNLGGGRALATKWGLAATGRLPWILKDRIDRGFVERYREVDSNRNA